MTYYFPFGVNNKTLSSSFANTSVSASFSASVNTKVVSASNALVAAYPGPSGSKGTSYTTANCPSGYIPCPGLSVPGYVLVCQELGSGCVSGFPACPSSIPSPSTTTTTTVAPATTTTTTVAPATTTTTTIAPTTTTTTTVAPTTTTTTTPPGTCYTAKNGGVGTSGTVSWNDPTLGAQSTTIAAGNKINICSTTTPIESPAADVIFYNCGTSCATAGTCSDCETP